MLFLLSFFRRREIAERERRERIRIMHEREECLQRERERLEIERQKLERERMERERLERERVRIEQVYIAVVQTIMHYQLRTVTQFALGMNFSLAFHSGLKRITPAINKL